MNGFFWFGNTNWRRGNIRYKMINGIQSIFRISLIHLFADCIPFSFFFFSNADCFCFRTFEKLRHYEFTNLFSITKNMFIPFAIFLDMSCLRIYVLCSIRLSVSLVLLVRKFFIMSMRGNGKWRSFYRDRKTLHSVELVPSDPKWKSFFHYILQFRGHPVGIALAV